MLVRVTLGNEFLRFVSRSVDEFMYYFFQFYADRETHSLPMSKGTARTRRTRVR